MVEVGQGLPCLMIIAGMQMVGLGGHHGRVGLLREDTALVVHNPGLAEEGAGEEFEVETYLAEQCLRNGAIQVYSDFDVLAFTFYTHGIGKVVVRVNHRVESGEVT